MKFPDITEKFASLGIIISALGCASCFPVLGSLGAIIGLCFLAQYEVLATLYLFWTEEWSEYMVYSALILMIVVSIWDIISPPMKVCKTKGDPSCQIK